MVSLLGRVGRCMAIDRLLEYVNLLQQKRMNAFIGFDTALHHTPLLRAMLHADHAYEEAVHGAAKTLGERFDALGDGHRVDLRLLLDLVGLVLEHGGFLVGGVELSRQLHDGDLGGQLGIERRQLVPHVRKRAVGSRLGSARDRVEGRLSERRWADAGGRGRRRGRAAVRARLRYP